jgi:AcrR family transcriptional regulator
LFKQPEPLLKRNPKQTVQNILAAAIQEFSRAGLDGARVDEIAKRAGTNKSQIYYYYQSKDGLFLAALESNYSELRVKEAQLELAELSPVAQISVIIDFIFDYFVQHDHFIVMLNDENLHKARHVNISCKIKRLGRPLVDKIKAALDEGAEAGLFRANVDPVHLYFSIAGLAFFYVSNRHTLGTIFLANKDPQEFMRDRRRHAREVVLGYLRP